MLESLCINRKAKAFCVLLQLYIPSEIVRKILFLMLKMEVSVIDVSLLNFLTTFSSALKDFSRASLAPSSIRTQLYVEMYGSVGLSPLSEVGTSVFSFLSVKMTTYSLVSTVNILILKFIWRCAIFLY